MLKGTQSLALLPDSFGYSKNVLVPYNPCLGHFTHLAMAVQCKHITQEARKII